MTIVTAQNSVVHQRPAPLTVILSVNSPPPPPKIDAIMLSLIHVSVEKQSYSNYAVPGAAHFLSFTEIIDLIIVLFF